VKQESLLAYLVIRPILVSALAPDIATPALS